MLKRSALYYVNKNIKKRKKREGGERKEQTERINPSIFFF